MAYDPSKLVNLQTLKESITRVKQEYLESIAQSGHAIFQKAEAVPDPEDAQENILYLVKNTETGFYDIYALVDGAVERLDDTSVDLDGYVTDEDLSQALQDAGAGTVYNGTKTSLEQSDSAVISAYFEEHDEASPKLGDVFVVTTTVDDVTYEMSAYWYTGTEWTAITGAVDADKVIMREDITLAGDYTQFGNLSKSANGTATLEAQGKSVADVLSEILSKRLQPTITAQPNISGFNLSGAKAVEAGTKLATASYTAAPAATSTARRPVSPPPTGWCSVSLTAALSRSPALMRPV